MDTSYLDQISGFGLEGIGVSDVSTPRIKILQQLSPELQPGSPKHDPAALAGDFYLTAPEQRLGTRIHVIPLATQEVWYEWQPNRGGLLARHRPGTIRVDTSDYSAWRSLETGNQITENRDWMIILVDSQGTISPVPILFSMTGAKIRASKAWVKKLKLAKTLSGHPIPIMGCVWGLQTVKETNQRGTFFTLSEDLVQLRYVSQSELATLMKAKDAADALQDSLIGGGQSAVPPPVIEAVPPGGRITLGVPPAGQSAAKPAGRPTFEDDLPSGGWGKVSY